MGVPGCNGISLAKTDYCVKRIYASDRTDVGDNGYIFSSNSDSSGQQTSAAIEEEESAASERIVFGSLAVLIGSFFFV